MIKKILDWFELWSGTIRYFMRDYWFEFAMLMITFIAIWIVQKLVYIN